MATAPPTLLDFDDALRSTRETLHQIRDSVRALQTCIDSTRQVAARSRAVLADVEALIATSRMPSHISASSEIDT